MSKCFSSSNFNAMNKLFRKYIPDITKGCKKVSKYSTMMRAVDPVQEASLEENCILVDEADREFSYASKRDCHKVKKDGSLLLHRAFSVFLFNSKNQLLLQQRNNTKITYPNYFSNSCCSHPLYDIKQERNSLLGVKLAAQRRLNIELGIPKEQCPLDAFNYITRLHYEDKGDGIWGEHEITYILLLHRDVDINPNLEEVSTALYVGKDDIKQFTTNLKFPVTPWFDLIYEKWLSKWWDNLDNLNQFKDNEIHKF